MEVVMNACMMCFLDFWGSPKLFQMMPRKDGLKTWDLVVINNIAKLAKFWSIKGSLEFCILKIWPRYNLYKTLKLLEDSS
jgi:hypothetical protein